MTAHISWWKTGKNFVVMNNRLHFLDYYWRRRDLSAHSSWFQSAHYWWDIIILMPAAHYDMRVWQSFKVEESLKTYLSCLFCMLKITAYGQSVFLSHSMWSFKSSVDPSRSKSEQNICSMTKHHSKKKEYYVTRDIFSHFLDSKKFFRYYKFLIDHQRLEFWDHIRFLTAFQ